MNVFLYELSFISKQVIIWNIAIVGVLLLMMIFYPSIADDSEAFTELINSYPPETLSALGIVPESITTVVGYFAYAASYVFLIGGMMALILGTNILAKDLRLKTNDFLLTKPISRISILTGKLATVLLSIIITNIIFIGSSLLIASYVSPSHYDQGSLVLIALSLLLIQLFFVGFGMILSVVLKIAKSVISVSIGIVFGFYIVGLLAGVTGETYYRYLTPFRAIDTNYVLANGTIELSYIYYYLTLTVVFIALTYVIFVRKDIHSV